MPKRWSSDVVHPRNSLTRPGPGPTRRRGRLLWLPLALFLLLPLARSASGFWDAGADSRRLAKLPVLNQTLLRVRESYYDPGRVVPEKMFDRAEEELQRSIPEFRLEKSPDGSFLTLFMDREKTNIPGKIGNLFELQNRLSLSLQFIDRHRRDRSESVKDLENKVIRSTLATLDPHTSYLTAKDWEQTLAATQGHFSGVGLQLGMRDDPPTPTVIAPMENTPAWRAGIKTGDKIVEVDGQSTVNMLLDEVVDLIRGPEDQEVLLGIQRKGNAETLHYKMKRANIQVQSVESALLPGAVAYLRLKNFQEKSDQDLRQALAALARGKNKLKGLIFDLRYNPGGLLEQAVAVSNLFLAESQEIVKTVGPNNTYSDLERASGRDAELKLPMAVLINSGSASASEIVAGALKYNQRAVTVGERSFGKGSVQKVFKLPEDNRLKLTVQEYLTPGNRSIQSFGITPDFETYPAYFSKELIDIFPNKKAGREEEIKGALRRHNKDDDPARYHVQYLFRAKDEADRELRPPPQTNEEKVQQLMEQFEVRLAREIVLAAPGTDRSAILDKSGVLVQKVAAEEAKKVTAELAKEGIDWRSPPAAAPVADCQRPPLALLEMPPGKERGEAGQKLTLTLKVKNVSGCPLYQLRGTTAARKTLFDQREFLVGYLPPQAEVRRSLEFAIPEGLPTQENLLSISFQSAAGPVPREIEKKVSLQGKEPPLFAYSAQWLDDGSHGSTGSGDGLVQQGETLALRLTVTNIGRQKSAQGVGTIKNLSGPGIYIKNGRAKLSDLGAGESKDLFFNLQVQPNYRADRFQLEIGIFDTTFRSFLSDKLAVRIWRKTPEVQKLSLAVCPKKKGLPFYAGASAEDLPLGQALATSCFAADQKTGDFYRVALNDDSRVFFRIKDVSTRTETPPAPAPDTYRLAPQKSPPRFESVKYGELKDQLLPLTISLHDDEELADLYLFRGNDKIFYESVPGQVRQKTFNLAVPLKPGYNDIVAVARDRHDLASRYLLVRQNGKEPAEAEEEELPLEE